MQQPSFVISFPLCPLKNWKKNIGIVGKCEKCILKFYNVPKLFHLGESPILSKPKKPNKISNNLKVPNHFPNNGSLGISHHTSTEIADWAPQGAHKSLAAL